MTARRRTVQSSSGRLQRRHPRRGGTPLIYAITSARTGVTRYYGDFRKYADVGGAREPLVAPGERLATTCPRRAAALYDEHLAAYTLRRQNGLGASRLPVDPRLGPAAVSHLRQRLASRRHSTVRRDRAALRHLVLYFGNCRLSEITPERLGAYVRTRLAQASASRPGHRVAPQTVRNELHALSALFRRAVAMGLCRSNPVAALIDKPTAGSTRATHLSLREVARLLDAGATLDRQTARAGTRVGPATDAGRAEGLRAEAAVARRCPHVEAVLATLFYTGGRLREVLGLEVGDVDFEAGTVWFRANRHRPLKRDRHERMVELWPALAATLRRHLQESGICAGLLFPGKTGGMIGSFATPFRRALEVAGLLGGRGGITRHTLRHSFATHLLHVLIPTEDGGWAARRSDNVARRLGHKTATLVDACYGHLIVHPVYARELSCEQYRESPAARDAEVT